MPITKAGLPVVVSVVPEQDAVKDNGAAADQTVVLEVFQVPAPLAQYLSAMLILLQAILVLLLELQAGM
jgi:hypothetical protein